MLTEDIDVSWKLQTRGWRVCFEPNALVWILMPETLTGLWRQRLRWATGGVQVVSKFRWLLRDRRQWRMWPIYLEYTTSLIWSHAMVVTLLMGVAGLVGALPPQFAQATLMPGWCGAGIASACMLQFALSVWMDSRYDVRLHRYLWSAIWYPVVFWMVGMMTSVAAGPQFLRRRRGQRAVWVSPDRGLQQVQT
jgi:biofilm PGA synthesis N-glycosyltransferase PgaC